jgi:hypothetical protein
MRVVAIDDRAFTPDVIKASKTSSQTVRFLTVNEDYYETFTLNYQGGRRTVSAPRPRGRETGSAR